MDAPRVHSSCVCLCARALRPTENENLRTFERKMTLDLSIGKWKLVVRRGSLVGQEKHVDKRPRSKEHACRVRVTHKIILVIGAQRMREDAVEVGEVN